MKLLFYTLLLTLVTSSCTLFKKISSTASKSVQHSTWRSSFSDSAGTTLLDKSVLYTQNNDATKADFSIRFWPKGEITYSALNGFSGNMDSVVVTGTQLQQNDTKSATQINVNEKNYSHSKLNSVQDTLSNTKKKTKTSSIDWKLIICLLIGTCVVIWIWTKKIILQKILGSNMLMLKNLI